MIFLNGIKSEISGTPMNQIPSNLSKEELAALKQLIELQKEKVIVIKPCDKGGGILIADFAKYELFVLLGFPKPKHCLKIRFTDLEIYCKN